jgi:hypothetical protein
VQFRLQMTTQEAEELMALQVGFGGGG